MQLHRGFSACSFANPTTPAASLVTPPGSSKNWREHQASLQQELDAVNRRLFALGMDDPYGPEPADTKEGQSLLNRKAELETQIAEAERVAVEDDDAKTAGTETVETTQNEEVDRDSLRQYTENEKGNKHFSNKENALFSGYQGSIERGKLSPMVSFELYKKYYDEVQTIIGTKVGDTEITGQSQHFLERVFGCASDPKTGKPRNGVAIEEVLDCLKNPIEIWPVRESNSGKSFVVVGKRAKISVNPDTGKLIQINPRR